MHISSIVTFVNRVLVCLVCLAALPAQALDPRIGLDGYRHDRWGDVEGAPSLIDAMAQTDDGWLWLGTRRTGLYRFDGVRFTAYTTRDGSTLQHPSISALRAGAGNDLWIGHGITGGVSVLRDHRIRHILGPATTGSVFAIAQGADGSTWIAGRAGLFRIRRDVAEHIGAERGYDGPGAEYVMADRQGRVWAAGSLQLFVLDPGAEKFRLVRAVNRDPTVIEAHDGSTWLVTGKRFERLTPPAPPRIPARPGRGNSYQSAFDADGNLWSGNCPVGLCVLRPGAWQDRAGFDALLGSERFDQGWQMTSLEVLSVLVDREENLWIGTTGGLERLRNQPVHFVGKLFDRGRTQALPHPDGSIVVLANQRMNGLRDHFLGMVDGEPVPRPNPLNVQLMARAPDGSLVLAGSEGIERHHADHIERIPFPPLPASATKALAMRALMVGNDAIWLRVSGSGTWHFEAGKWQQAGFLRSQHPAIAFDAAGRTYIGDEDRLTVRDGAGVRQIDTAAADVGDIDFIHAGDEVIVSGTRGYGVLRGARLEALRIAPQKALGPVSGIARTADGAYWLNASHGLFRVDGEDWARAMRNPAPVLHGTLFDALDGYLGGAETTWLHDTVFVARDGKMWFAGERGLAWLDPRAWKPNGITADVDILGLASDGKRYRPGSPIELGPGARDVVIDYSSPSLHMPQRIKFRYRLLGADTQWEDAGIRRTAFYKHLAPGDYTFEASAVNEHGVASSRAGILRFRIAPHLTQTAWFRTLCIAAGIAILFLAYRLRVRHLAARMEERFSIRTAERESLARSLHDTFLQSLQGLLLSMQALTPKLPPQGTARRELDTLIERARRVLVEGRDEVKGLRSEFDSGAQLRDVLLRDMETILPGSGARIALSGAEAIDRLDPRLHHDVYAIAREALVNALCHTAGPVAIQARDEEQRFVLTVRDHGRGLDPSRRNAPGHYGLRGMLEHAAQIGARLDIDNAEEGGARIVLSIPAGLAYRHKDRR